MITAGISYTFKQEILQGIHLASHTYKIALLTSASTAAAASTTSYTGIDGEVANGNGYTTGGATLSGYAAGRSGATSWLDWSDVTWANATITARGAVIYNDSLAGKNVLAIVDFGADKTSTNGPFTVQFPTADASNAIIRIS